MSAIEIKAKLFEVLDRKFALLTALTSLKQMEDKLREQLNAENNKVEGDKVRAEQGS